MYCDGGTNMAHTPEFRKAALYHAKDIKSMSQAAKDYGIDLRTMYRWNDEYKICEVKQIRFFTDEEKKKMLTYANLHSLTGAEREFKVDVHTLLEWNKVFHIYNPNAERTDITHKKEFELQDEDFKLTVLNFVKENSLLKAVHKYKLPRSTIQYWNGIYRVYDARKCRTFTDEQKQEIIQYANETSVADAAKKYKLYGHQITRWKNNKQRTPEH